MRVFGRARLAGYIHHCGGDVTDALELYRWNAEISATMWEPIGHLEVALRNALAGRLAARHRRLGRSGSWLDPPQRELTDRAQGEVADAGRRVRRNRKHLTDGQIISELGFGFWRFLVSRRNRTTLWPDLATGFPHAPNRRIQTVEEPLERVHAFRNRLAHHHRIWSQPIDDRYNDVLRLAGYIDPVLADWIAANARVHSVLARRPR